MFPTAISQQPQADLNGSGTLPPFERALLRGIPASPHEALGNVQACSSGAHLAAGTLLTYGEKQGMNGKREARRSLRAGCSPAFGARFVDRLGGEMAPVPGQVLVIYGITGDLSRRKILPALHQLVRRGTLNIPVIGVDRDIADAQSFHQLLRDSITAHETPDDSALRALQARTTLVPGDMCGPELYTDVHRHLPPEVFAVHYLAVPPALFTDIADGLARAGLARRGRLVVEKPFGHDRTTAQQLNRHLLGHFPESRLRRVDHYLGKEPVQDILTIRFANSLLEPLWSRAHVASVEITMAESIGVEGRGSFYDAVGATRDVLQNHVLQVLAYLAMEPPADSSAEAQRAEKPRVLRSVRTPSPSDVVIGQYTGYQAVPGIAPASTTETYVAARLWIDNWRWADVPFTVRAGKRLATTATEIAVRFHRPPRMLFLSPTAGRPEPNVIRFRLQPDPAVLFDLQAKTPGRAGTTSPVRLSVDLAEALGPLDQAYERILSDAISGDPRTFARQDTVEEAWRIVDPILHHPMTPYPYRPGSWGPTIADTLVPGDHWLPLSSPAP